MISEIDFDRISDTWKTFLWPERYINGREMERYNLEGKYEYWYAVIKRMSPDNRLRVLNPKYIGYFEKNRLVGVLSGYKTNYNHYRVRGMWVNIHYRRKGIATKMIRYMENEAKENNCKYIWSIPRESAVELYMKLGYKNEGKCCNTIYGATFYVRKEI